MKTMSQVLHIQDCPETLDEARAMIAQQAARISQLVADKRDMLREINRLSQELKTERNALEIAKTMISSPNVKDETRGQ